MLRVYVSDSLDPCVNLAREDCLMEQAEACTPPVLFFWRSSPSVVLGKNQNPWLECHMRAMRADGIPLLRRISGGGTVWHDPGNLNFCMVFTREQYHFEMPYRVIISALYRQQVSALLQGKSNLAVGRKKVSGNAFCYRRDRVMHHGTLLLNADLQRMSRYLKVEPHPIETHAVTSDPASVMNLQAIDAERLQTDIVKALRRELGLPAVEKWAPGDLSDFDAETIRLGTLKNNDPAWVLGNTPKFSYSLEADCMDGRLKILLHVRHHRIIDVEGVPEGGEGLLGLPFDGLILHQLKAVAPSLIKADWLARANQVLAAG